MSGHDARCRIRFSTQRLARGANFRTARRLRRGRHANAQGMLVLHDDATREFAYGPANGLPATSVGTFSQALLDEAKDHGWEVISMKQDWSTIFRP